MENFVHTILNSSFGPFLGILAACFWIFFVSSNHGEWSISG